MENKTLSKKFEERIEEWKNTNLNFPLKMGGEDIAQEIQGNIMRDVKEFIKELKEKIRIQEKNRNVSLYYIQEELDKLAGDQLI